MDVLPCVSRLRIDLYILLWKLKYTVLMKAAITQSHLDIDAFICLADAGDGGRGGLAGIGCGTGVVWRIQKALL